MRRRCLGQRGRWAGGWKSDRVSGQASVLPPMITWIALAIPIVGAVSTYPTVVTDDQVVDPGDSLRFGAAIAALNSTTGWVAVGDNQLPGNGIRRGAVTLLNLECAACVEVTIGDNQLPLANYTLFGSAVATVPDLGGVTLAVGAPGCELLVCGLDASPAKAGTVAITPSRSHLPLTPAAHPAALAGAVYLLRLASEADCQADPAACLLSWVVIEPMQGGFNPSPADLDTYQHFGQAIAALPGFHSQGGAGLALAVGAGTDFSDDIPGAGMTGIQGTVFILLVDTTGVQLPYQLPPLPRSPPPPPCRRLASIRQRIRQRHLAPAHRVGQGHRDHPYWRRVRHLPRRLDRLERGRHCRAGCRREHELRSFRRRLDPFPRGRRHRQRQPRPR